jgi:hypothetical protein
MHNELVEITENGLTLAEELDILDRAENDETVGPFSNAKSLMKSLNKK